MIFVTVGTAHFNPLIEKIDELIKNGEITDDVVGQIGRGSYIPKHFRSFRFMKSLQQAYDRADVIVSTGGAGTTIECVTRGLKLVVVENTTLMEGHQSQLIGEMALVDHGPRSATVKAVQDPTYVQVIKHDEFEALCQRNTQIGYRVMQNLAVDLSFKLRHRNLSED